MTFDQVLTQLQLRGIVVAFDGPEVLIIGDEDALDTTFCQELREHKEEFRRRFASSPAPAGKPLNGTPISTAAMLTDDVNIQDSYILTPAQEGMLFHHILGVDRDPYVLRTVYNCDSREAVGRYVAALQTVVDRYDVLRTSFIWEGLSSPLQIVWHKVAIDVTEGPPFQESIDAAALIQRLRAYCRPIDLRQAPLIQLVAVPQQQSSSWFLLVTLHHIISDHVSFDIIRDELASIMRGHQSALPKPIQFRPFARTGTRTVGLAEHERFFSSMLAGVETPTLPFSLLDVRGDGSSIIEAQLPLNNRLVSHIRDVSRELLVSPAALFHLAWAQVVARTSGRPDVVFGSVLLGRTTIGEDALRAVGPFINTLPVKIAVDKRSPQAAVLETHALLVELMRHEHASLALAQRCSNVSAGTPLFSSILNFRHSRAVSSASSKSSPESSDSLPDMRVIGDEERTNYPVAISIDDLHTSYVITAQVHKSVEPAKICELFACALEALVVSLRAGDNDRICDTKILPESERRLVVEEWNDTVVEFPDDVCVHELFEEQVSETPDATAVVYEDEIVSYGELNGRANQLAHYLREIGIGPDSRVAICVERSIEMVVALLAVLKAGGAYVPLDPEYPLERLEFMIRDSSPAALLLQGSGSKASEIEASIPSLDLMHPTPPWAEHPKENPDPAQVGLTSTHLAYVIYTSGSTGTPKGVMVEHRSVVNRLMWMAGAYEVVESDTILQKTPFTFDVSVWELLMPLVVGARLVMARPGGHRDPDYLIMTIRSADITMIHFVPSMLQSFLERAGDMASTALRHVVCSGEELSNRLATDCVKYFSGASLHNLYGPTEATVDVTAWTCCSGTGGTSVPIGRPIANTRIYILDAFGDPVPVGVTGELYIGGIGVARGYLNRPELTAERFVKDPFVDGAGARMYRTGDLARWRSDGVIEFWGRNDSQVKIRGFRIELGEIEASLVSYPGVREAVVVAREDTPGEKRIVAYYLAAEGVFVESAQLREHLASTLPEYMIPAAYVKLCELPVTPNGKLDRQALPIPQQDAYATRGYVPPRGEIETLVAQVWADVLNVDRVGRHDNFFQLGGHSLLAVRMISRIRQIRHIEVPLGDLFTRPVLAAFAEGLVAAKASLLPAITPAERTEHLPLSFAQQRLWFLAQLERQGSAYHVSIGVRLRGRLDRVALRRALDRIVTRHEALRTTFISQDGHPLQRIAPSDQSSFPLRQSDLQNDGDSNDEIERALMEAARVSFDLETGPLIRGHLLRKSDDNHVLLITMHHIISDGWSVNVFCAELGAIYGAYVSGGVDPLPELDLHYVDYAIWQRKWIEGEELQRQGVYWRRTLANAPTLLDLPTDYPRPQEHDYSGAFMPVALDARLAARLHALARRHDTTLYLTLLAGWAALLGALSRQEEILTGMPVANRGQVEVEGLIGFFVNTLVLRIDLSGSPTVSELLRRVTRCAVHAQENQDIPFEQVVELVNPIRTLAYTPLFQAMFVWQTAPEEMLAFPGLASEPLESPVHPVAEFDLTLSLGEVGDTVAGGIDYATALFTRSTVRRFKHYFLKVLDAMVADETVQVNRISLMSESERRLVVEEWNDTVVEFPDDVCVHELFEEQVSETPDATAVVYEDEIVSYGELNGRANQLAHYLREIGIGPDSRVAICVERSIEMVVALLAVLKAGGAYVPLDPEYPLERLEFMIRDSSPAALLLQGSGSKASEIEASIPSLDLMHPTPPWAEHPKENPDPAQVGLTSTHLAYVIYTSGSTGTPKGVMVEHRSLVNFLVSSQSVMGLHGGDTVASLASHAFDISLFEILTPLLCGAKLAVAISADLRSPDDLAAFICNRKVTMIEVVPSILDILTKRLALQRGVSLRHLISGSEVLEASVGIVAACSQAGSSTLRRNLAVTPTVRRKRLYGCPAAWTML